MNNLNLVKITSLTCSSLLRIVMGKCGKTIALSPPTHIFRKYVEKAELSAWKYRCSVYTIQFSKFQHE